MENSLENNIKYLWNKKRIFHMERDKFKPRIFISNGTIDLFNDKTNLSLYKGLLINDIYSRYYKMRGYNVYYSFGYNNISKVSFFKKNTLNQKENEDFIRLENNIHSLGLSNDDKKEFRCDSNSFTEFAQKFFLYLKDEGLIKVENRLVYTDDKSNNIYNPFEVSLVNENYYLKSTGNLVKEQIKEVVILDIKEFAPDIIKEINLLNVDNPVKNKLKSVLIPHYGLKIKLTNTYKDVYFEIDMDHPEYVGGLDFISMNPDLIDVKPFIGEEESSIVKRYIDGEDLLGVYSGTYFVNPLTGRAIPIIISRKYEKSYHLGISSIYKNDYLFCGLLHLDNENIIEEERLINSDFISGLDLKTAHKQIIEAFSKEDFSSITYTFLNTEIIISNTNDYGLLIPLYSDGINYKSTPKEHLPFYLASKVSLALQSSAGYGSKFNLFNGVFNQYYVIGLANIATRLFANEMEIPNFLDSGFKEIYNEYAVTKNLVVKENYLFHEIFMPIVFRKIMQKKYPDLLSDNIKHTTILYNRDKYESNINFSEIKMSYGIDSFRMYLCITSNDSLEEINFAKLEYCKKFIREVEDLFFRAKINNYYKNDFYEVSTKLTKYLDENNISAYTRVLTDYVSTLKADEISIKFGLNILKLLYLIIPHTVERIYLEKYKSKHFLLYDEWTL